VVLSLPQLLTRLRVIVFHDDYTHFVRVMKVALPALAILLLGIVVIWARLAAQTDGFRIGYAAITSESVKNLRMLNARYFGIDESNNPYSISADAASQRSQNSDLVDMTSPKADFVSRSGASVIISADRGLYHQHSQLLDLEGNVSVYHELGYELHTEVAHIDMKTNAAQGELAVEGHGPQGRLDGTGFKILDRGERIVVLGKSAVSLQGASKSKSGGKSK